MSFEISVVIFFGRPIFLGELRVMNRRLID
jgi:hypothetical protein